jgi:hypothetical protein
LVVGRWSLVVGRGRSVALASCFLRCAFKKINRSHLHGGTNTWRKTALPLPLCSYSGRGRQLRNFIIINYLLLSAIAIATKTKELHIIAHTLPYLVSLRFLY